MAKADGDGRQKGESKKPKTEEGGEGERSFTEIFCHKTLERHNRRAEGVSTGLQNSLPKRRGGDKRLLLSLAVVWKKSGWQSTRSCPGFGRLRKAERGSGRVAWQRSRAQFSSAPVLKKS